MDGTIDIERPLGVLRVLEITWSLMKNGPAIVSHRTKWTRFYSSNYRSLAAIIKNVLIRMIRNHRESCVHKDDKE